MRERRDETSAEYMQLASGRISERVLASSEFANASDVGAYYSAGSEAHTHGLLRAILKGGRRLYLPRMADGRIEFGRVSAMDELTAGAGHGAIMEPPRHAKAPVHMDVIFIPAVAASLSGHRLGHGSGHYDRYLAGLSSQHPAPDAAIIVILILEKQIVKSIPAEPHDVRADIIITEKRTIRCATFGGGDGGATTLYQASAENRVSLR